MNLRTLDDGGEFSAAPPSVLLNSFSIHTILKSVRTAGADASCFY